MEALRSNLLIALILFIIFIIVGMVVWPIIDSCSFRGMDCFYEYSFSETLIKSVISSAIISSIIYVILKVFRRKVK